MAAALSDSIARTIRFCAQVSSGCLAAVSLLRLPQQDVYECISHIYRLAGYW